MRTNNTIADLRSSGDAVTTTTTDSLDGQEVTEYLGVVSGEAGIGANVVSDIAAGTTDVTIDYRAHPAGCLMYHRVVRRIGVTHMGHRIDINCDMGESFGKYTKGRDAEVMPYVTTANIAGGFHAGDSHVMRRTVALADEHDVDVGVHPGLPDKLGFGRRTMDASPEEVRDYVIYQLGALRAFTDCLDVTFQHVKPHGAMYTMLSESEEHTRAVIEGILDVDEDLVYLATDMNIYEVAQEYPIRSVFEGYVDLDYRPDRSVVIPREKEARKPELVADRFVSIATEGIVETPEGEVIDVPADSICIHGDTPNIVEILEEIHGRLDGANIELASVTDIV